MSLTVSKKKPRDTIKFIVQKRQRTKESAIPKKYRDREPVQLFFQKGSTKTTVKQINNKRKLARKVYENYGAGQFNILFWGGAKNHKYHANKRCTPGHNNHKHCNKKSCKKNRKIVHNWRVRARITITEKPLSSPPFSYEYDDHKMMMNKFGWWKE